MRSSKQNHLWLVYDAECPLCSATARALKIRSAVGNLHIINAREPSPIVTEINRAGISLDEGIVVKFNDTLYHGADAQHLLAMVGSDHDWFNRINVFLFRHKFVAKLLYPICKLMRNLLLMMRGKSAINNLKQTLTSDRPLFQSVFADKWDQLPAVMRKHYSNRPYTEDVVKVEGVMNVNYSPGFAWLMPLFKLFKVLVPYKEENIPVIVYLRSDPQAAVLHYERTFYLANKPPYRFQSFMQPIKDNFVIEMMPNNIAWCTRYIIDENKMILHHNGYACKLFGKLIRLPLSILLGRVYLEKQTLSNDSFSLQMEIKHFLFGTYSYSGVLTIVPHEYAESRSSVNPEV